MSLLVHCPNCSSQFKAPKRLAGRAVRCLKCNRTIDVPSGRATAAPSPPGESPPESLPAESISAETVARPDAWLMALLVTGIGVAFFLAVAVVVILVNKQIAGTIAGGSQKTTLPSEFTSPTEPAPIERPVQEVKPPPENKVPPPNRAERLAAIEAEESEILAALQTQADKHKQPLQKLGEDELALFPKNVKMNAGQIAKLKARTDAFTKEQAAVLRQAVKDAAAVERKREEFLQRKRKLLFEHPESGDVKLQEHNGMLLTADEIAELKKREATAATPRDAALPYVQKDEVKAVLKGTYYAGTFQDPAIDDVAAIVYRVGAYRDKSDMQVHAYLFRQHGVWQVLELPGRANTVYIGTPPSEYKRTDSAF